MDNGTKTSSKDKANATWSRNDEAILVRALKKAKDDGQWGDNNPKDVAWNACVAALHGSEKVSGGAPKNAKVVRRRWQRVRTHHISCVVCVSSCLFSSNRNMT
jgi:hypothetical protein